MVQTHSQTLGIFETIDICLSLPTIQFSGKQKKQHFPSKILNSRAEKNTTIMKEIGLTWFSSGPRPCKLGFPECGDSNKKTTLKMRRNFAIFDLRSIYAAGTLFMGTFMFYMGYRYITIRPTHMIQYWRFEGKTYVPTPDSRQGCMSHSLIMVRKPLLDTCWCWRFVLSKKP